MRKKIEIAKELLTATGDYETSLVEDLYCQKEYEVFLAIRKLAHINYDLAILCIAVIITGSYSEGSFQLPPTAAVLNNVKAAKKIMKGKKHLTIEQYNSYNYSYLFEEERKILFYDFFSGSCKKIKRTTL